MEIESYDSEIVSDKSGSVQSDEELIRERKEKIKRFFTNKYSWVSYVVLGVLVYISVKIRTRNLDGLRDITTGGWTLGPDLDPFLFMRWAKHIVENGSLMAIDTLRYVPLGFETKFELIFHPHLIAWFHQIAVIFGSSSVEQSSAVFPVFMFALTVIAFFFLVRKIFDTSLGSKQANAIALVSSFFLIVIPSLLPRTIAGIPEKESSAFLFLFLAFYFFLKGWRAKSREGGIGFSLLAGLSTAGMALIWGGFIYIFITLALTVFIAFILGNVNKRKLIIYGVWLISSIGVMSLFSNRYDVISIVSSATTGISVFVFAILLVHLLIFKTRIKKYLNVNGISKIPKPIVSILVTILAILIISPFFFGTGFVFDKVDSIIGTLVTPTTGRIGVTVAENRQPYFGEWSSSFGPIIGDIPVFFWLFVIGSVYLFFNLVKAFKKKEKYFLTLAYFIFLLSIIFSRYSPNSTLNGENFASLSLYFGGVLILLFVFGYYYYKYYFSGRQMLKEIDFNLIFLFALFFFSIISARGAVRLIMVLGVPASIIVGYFAVSLASKIKKPVNGKKWVILIITCAIILATVFAGWQFYQISNSSASGFVPSVYNQQWQKAMSWVRLNTKEDSVFGHWWDYGYWIQSIGERATVLDGGNAIGYWNHLMGRHALTGPDERLALEYLYAHNTTHFLIDSTDIGKYAAFSSIGSNVDYDRRSWIQTFGRDNSQIFETKNRTIHIYTGGTTLDEDVVYILNGEKIFLPGINDQSTTKAGNVAGVGAIKFEIDNDGNVLQPVGIFVYSNKQYEIPLRYLYRSNGDSMDFGTGLEAGIFLFPRINQVDNQIQLEENGALLYLSRRTVNSQLARLYLYGQETDSIKVAHIEEDFLVNQLKAEGVPIDGNFAQFRGFRGPIKIWEINYPSDIKYKKEYTDINYPQDIR